MSHKVPDGWTTKSLGELFEFKNGFNADKSMYGKGKKFINVMEVINKQSLFEKDILGQVDIPDDSFSLYSVVKGDVLFNRTSETPDEIGLTAVYLDDKPVTFGGFVIRARPIGKDLDTSFCKYCFSTNEVRKEIIKRGQGAIRANIGQGDLSDVFIQIPSKKEQEKIAKILSTWDEAIEKLNRMLVLKVTEKRFICTKLLTGKKRFRNFGSSRVSESLIPSGWREISLGDVLIEHREKATSNNQHEVMTSSRRGLILQSEYYDGENRITNRNNSGFNVIPPGYFTYRSRSDDGSFFFNRNTLGKTGCISTYYPVFKFADSSDDFFYYLLNRNNKIFEKYSVGTSQKVLSLNALKEIKFVVPPKNEQEKIAKCLSILDEEIKKNENLKFCLIKQKQGLMQQLLTGKKRVKL